MKHCNYIFLVLYVALFASCSKNYQIPQNAQKAVESVRIYPDYTNIVIPPNIAPLNFMVRNTGSEFVAVVKCGNHQILAGADEDGKIMFDSTAWRQQLSVCKGKKMDVTLYIKRETGWIVLPSYFIQVAEEPVDAYLTYRLIEPGYELYRQLGIYQRNLTTFDVHTVYENNRKYHANENHCINCHNFQNYNANTMLFHVRGNMGGTLIAKDGKVEKINPKNDSILGSCVYPSWNPRHNWVIFSSNKTGQTFHLLNKEKTEVIDSGSDLVFYNADTKQISNVLKTPIDMETFPCWNPAGNRVYYCVCRRPEFVNIPDSMRARDIVINYNHVRYNLMSIPFDEKTQTFGKPQLEYDCVSHGKSCSVPRVSPDGRYVLFTLGDYGQFHIWHKSSDLYVKDLKTGRVYPMKASNSKDVDSFHSWSSNGRWFVFSSRRNDGSFTRPYFAYFDHNGQSHKAFMLPQKDPEQNLLLFKSYNVPELTRNAVKFTFKQFHDAIYNHVDGTPATYKEIRQGMK